MVYEEMLSRNLRDDHFARTPCKIVGHPRDDRGRQAKFVVWAHTSHIDGVRATNLGPRSGECLVAFPTPHCS